MGYYSKEQRSAIVNQYLVSGLSLREFSKREGIAKSTLYTWSRQLQPIKLSSMKKTGLTSEQRFAIVLETSTLSEVELSKYCREKGIYPDQVHEWKKACMAANSEKNQPVAGVNKTQSKRIKELEKELLRKEKALAETAALLVLRKKFNARYGLDEEL